MDANNLIRAAAWRKHLTETDAESTEAFEHWLAADAGHREAWQQVQDPWEELEAQANSPQMLAYRRAALEFGRVAAQRQSRRAAWFEHRMRVAWAAGIALMVAGVLSVWFATRADVYRTALGERRVVTLTDGSTVALDASSEVRVSYSDKARDLTLARGQARFEVAHDPERPFSVHAREQKVVAMGTAFNVDLLRHRLFVTLLEGRVLVVDQDTRRRVELKPGEQLAATDNAGSAVSTVQLDAAMAWQEGRIVCEGEPLVSVAERISRYAARPVEVRDPRAQALTVSGVFRAGDVDRFVTAMTEYLPVVAEPGRGGVILLRHR